MSPDELLKNAVKELLVKSTAGEPIADELQQLEDTFKLVQPDWNATEEIARRLAVTKYEFEEDSVHS